MVRVTRVLVVDDDSAVRETIIGFLEAFGIEATSASTLHTALVLIDGERPFDLVLADVVMPGGGGVQLADRLHERYPDLPVLLMTGRESRVDNMIEDGRVPLVKPFTALRLKEIIDETLER